MVITISPQLDKVYGPTDSKKITVPTMQAEFSSETTTELATIIKTKSGNLARARALAAYTQRHLTYSNNSQYNAIYDTHEKGYFAAIDEHRQADCDVANTYWAALCTQLNIPVRHCVGHSVNSVKGKDMGNAANITSGTGHAWSEVWDERKRVWIKFKWNRIDATPPGDPNLEEPERSDSSSIPGDYGEQEAIRPSDEQLEALRQKLAEQKEKLSYTKRERDLANATGVELKEARQIVKEMNEADQTRLLNGEKVVNVLGDLFSAIIKERKIITPTYVRFTLNCRFWPTTWWFGSNVCACRTTGNRIPSAPCATAYS